MPKKSNVSLLNSNDCKEKLTDVNALLERQDLSGSGDQLGQGCRCQKLRVGRVLTIQKQLAFVETVGAVLERDQRLLGLAPLVCILALVQLFAKHFELADLLENIKKIAIMHDREDLTVVQKVSNSYDVGQGQTLRAMNSLETSFDNLLR